MKREYGIAFLLTQPKLYIVHYLIGALTVTSL
jgi:hypothetical protein